MTSAFIVIIVVIIIIIWLGQADKRLIQEKISEEALFGF